MCIIVFNASLPSYFTFHTVILPKIVIESTGEYKVYLIKNCDREYV